MKVAFISELFPPYSTGGAEWSNYHLAQNLAKKNVDIVIITPNLGKKIVKLNKKIKFVKYPFYLKAKKTNSVPGHFAFTNPLWMVWSTFFILKWLRNEKVDVIHVQGKYSIPPTVLANIFLKKPILATIRDYIVICNYSLCLVEKDKACSLKEYFFKEFQSYYKDYVSNKNPATLLTNIIYAIWGKLTQIILKFFVNRLDMLTVMSLKEGQILSRNGIRVPQVVIRNAHSVKRIKYHPKTNRILFVGRLTYGKGVLLLLEAIGLVKEAINGFKFTFVGQGILKNILIQKSKKDKSIEYLGFQNQKELTKLYRNSILTVIPSIWPEPFSRVIPESLSNATPLVVTKSGGMPEVVKDGMYGYVSERNPRSLAEKIIRGLRNNDKLIKNIIKHQQSIRKIFGSEIVNKHIAIYKQLSQ